MSTTLQNESRPAQEEAVRFVAITPHADAWETEDAYFLAVEMPGVDDAHSDVTLEKNILGITGETAVSTFEGLRPAAGDYRPRQYRRSFRLPDGIDGAALDASMKNGVLTVRMPKSEQALRRKIAVRQA
ncbi:MAG: Hsp20/alpha crystallin family protein [Planctomyces sp.]|nr:Hsp20/alpha crystallin family protein [Planctomyces sp.]